MGRRRAGPWSPGGSPLTEPLLRLENATFRHPGRKDFLFQDFNLEIREGERVALFGANGSGKSTLLSILNGLRDLEGGALFYRGRRIDKGSLRNRELRRQFRSETVLLFQNPDVMLFHPTVREEIAFGPTELGLENVEVLVEEEARLCSLESVLDMPGLHLSGGERKRVAIASIMILKPRLFLLDEPTAGLDIPVARWFPERIRSTGAASVSSVHDLESAKALADRAVVLSPARKGILFDGPLQEYLSSPGLQRMARLL